jgi:hypothetical protein
MPTISALTSFTANAKIKSAEVNANFSAIRTTVNTYGAFVDASATITGAWTFTTAPTFSNAQTFAAAVTVTTGGITVTGNSTITGTLGVSGLLSASAGVTVTGTVTATTFSGSGASLTSIPASAISSGTLDSARLPTTFSSATTFSAGGAAVTISNNGRLVFAGSGTGRHAMDIPNPYLVSSTGSGGTTMYEPADGAGTVKRWDWLKVQLNNSPDVAWIPIFVKV